MEAQILKMIEKEKVDICELFKTNTLKKVSKLDGQKCLAKYFVENSPQNYIFCGGRWYKYNECNVLVLQHKTGDLILTVSDFLEAELEKLVQSIKDDDIVIKAINALIKRLASVSFVKGIVEYIEILYSDDKLLDDIDNKQHLFAFNNKVYDFRFKTLRPIFRTDFISITTGYDAPDFNNVDLKIMKELNDILLSIFNTQDIVNYWLDIMSQSLFNNSFQKLYIHTGGGANGKGLLFRLMYKCLGSYYIQTDSEFLSTSYVSGQANSTLYNTRGKRILAVSEPNASLNSKNLTAGFNISFIKILTGGDQISARELFMKQGATWSNQFTIHIQANDIPPIDKLDNGTRRRFITIEYPNTFTDKEGELNEFERKKDITLPEKLDMEEYYKTFIIMLINRTKDFEKMIIPNSIIETSTNYINSNNPLVDWISECCVLGDFKTKSSLLINNYNENTPKHQIDGKKLKKYFEALTTYNISFDKNNSLYKGIRLKTFDEKNDDPTITE